MSSFHCHNCGSVTDLTNMLQAFEQNPHCPTCGLSVSESDAKMQDELADLMSRNMHLGMQAPAHALDVSNPPTPQVVPQPAPITYISQHYHHSAHIAPTPSNDQSAVFEALQNAGVDIQSLLPSQQKLFREAPPDQRERLIELWRIAPPARQLVSHEVGNWPQTSIELEEEAARYRWDKQEQERLKNLSVLSSNTNAEPYMDQGYEDADMNMDCEVQEYRQAVDPAYNREREWWHMAGEQPMEHQYGMLQQMQMLHGFCGVVDKDRIW